MTEFVLAKATADAWLTLINRARTARVQAEIDRLSAPKRNAQSSVDSWGSWHGKSSRPYHSQFVGHAGYNSSESVSSSRVRGNYVYTDETW